MTVINWPLGPNRTIGWGQLNLGGVICTDGAVTAGRAGTTAVSRAGAAM